MTNTEDRMFLRWIHERFEHVYGESPNLDWMQRLDSLAALPRTALTARFARALHGYGMCRCADEATCQNAERLVSLIGGYDPNRDVPAADLPPATVPDEGLRATAELVVRLDAETRMDDDDWSDDPEWRAALDALAAALSVTKAQEPPATVPDEGDDDTDAQESAWQDGYEQGKRAATVPDDGLSAALAEMERLAAFRNGITSTAYGHCARLLREALAASQPK